MSTQQTSNKPKKKIIPKIIIFLIIIAVIIAAIRLLIFSIQGPGPEQVDTQVKYQNVEFPHSHIGDIKESLPFMGVSVLDADGDGLDEILVGGGHGQQDAIYSYDQQGFTSFQTSGLDKEEKDATFGVASLDVDRDGLEDLFLARESGVYYAKNAGEGNFESRKLEFGLAENTTPLSIALGDINRDGFVDLYISGYIKLKYAEGETNFSDDYGGHSYLLLNNGQNEWSDISQSSGIAKQHNRFLAVFADLNGDQWPDLVVAQDTGKVKIWENRKDNTFLKHEDPTDYAYPMGLGVGDIDNDGDVDLYFSNVGNTLPRLMVKGNLTNEQVLNMDYILLENTGNFTFKDISVAKNAANYGFGWGTTIADFNNDSRMDLYFSQNYARFPGAKYWKLYPGRLLEQQTDGTFLSVEKSAGAENPAFGITQVVSDFNKDGTLDLVIGNLQGPTKAFIAKETGKSKGISVMLPRTAEWLNAVGCVALANGTVLTRQLVASEGLCSDGFHGLHFGLGENVDAVDLEITRVDGKTYSYKGVKAGSQFIVSETAR